VYHAPRYDRQLLLGPKRDEILTLDEVRRYGQDSFGDPDYVCVYGLRPGEWYARGVRLLGRTAVECTRDPLARRMARDIAAVAGTAGAAARLALDLFAGSGNTPVLDHPRDGGPARHRVRAGSRCVPSGPRQPRRARPER